MKLFLNTCLSLLEKTLLPYYCILCLKVSDQKRDLCCSCQANLPISPHTCFQCGIALRGDPSLHRCGRCYKRPPYFDNTIVGFDYQTPIDYWLKQFKFHKKGIYARILSEIYAEKLAQILEQNPENAPQVLIPMPLHWRRLGQRGFNQAYIIAQLLNRKLKLPILKHGCVKRIKHTQPQSSLQQTTRRFNMRGAFCIKNIAGIEHVAIIDDIITTGSTVNELAQQLKLYGIKRVSVWAVARVN